MGIFSSIGSIFGGGAAADEIEEQARANIGDLTGEQGRQEAVNAPFLGRGTQGLNAFADLAMSPMGELDEVGEAILANAFRDTEGRLAARGLSDSGLGRNALLQTGLLSRLGLRRNRLSELGQLAGFGERGANRFNQIGQFGTLGRLGERSRIGDIRAENVLNRANILGDFGDTLLNIPSSPGELRNSLAFAARAGGFA